MNRADRELHPSPNPVRGTPVPVLTAAIDVLTETDRQIESAVSDAIEQLRRIPSGPADDAYARAVLGLQFQDRVSQRLQAVADVLRQVCRAMEHGSAGRDWSDRAQWLLDVADRTEGLSPPVGEEWAEGLGVVLFS